MNNFVSWSDEEEEELPFYERVARRAGLWKSPDRSTTDRLATDWLATDRPASNETDASITLTPPPPLSPPPARCTRSPPLRPVGNVKNPPIQRGEKSRDTQAATKVTKRRLKENTARPNKQAAAREAKAVKEAEKLVSKQTDKSEVNKYLLCCLDPELVSLPPGAEILSLLANPPTGKQEEVFAYKVENQPVPGSMTWRRRIVTYRMAVGGEVEFTDHWVEEKRCLLFISAEEAANKVKSGEFASWASRAKQQMAGKHLTLMLYNYNAHFRGDANARERTKKAAVRGEAGGGRGQNAPHRQLQLSQSDMQMALLNLSISRTADYLTFDRTADRGWRDCAAAVFHLARAVAEAPEKLKRSLAGSASFGFWARADSRDCVTGRNLPEYWKQVVMQVTSISLEKASAIVRLYPSPTTLLQAYRRCGSPKEAESLLADIEVRRVDTIVGGTRRVGEEISRRVYLALTCTDGQSLLAKE